MDSSNEVIKQIRDLIQKGGKIDPETRDILLFGAVANIYDKLDALEKSTSPAVIFSKIGLWLATTIGLGVIAFIGALLTHRIELTFR